MKFLLIEDNDELAHAICARMQFDGHVIDHASRIQDAFAFGETGDYDLILLDIMLPDGDGRTFLKRHRAGNKDTPVIVLTARSQVSDRISMLDLGADDYVTKPFDHEELQARCRAVLRRKAGAAQTTTRLGNVAFDPVAGSLTIDGQVIASKNKPFCDGSHKEAGFEDRGGTPEGPDRLFSYEGKEVSVTFNPRLCSHAAECGRIAGHVTTLRGLGYRLDHG